MARRLDRRRRPVDDLRGRAVVADGRVYITATPFAASQTITAVRCYPADSRDSAPVQRRQDVCARAG
jgi:hypothetical protein